jgi:hypothetical protein
VTGLLYILLKKKIYSKRSMNVENLTYISHFVVCWVMTPCSLVCDISVLRQHTASISGLKPAMLQKLLVMQKGEKEVTQKCSIQTMNVKKGEGGANRDQWQQYVVNRENTLWQKATHSYFYFINNAQKCKSHSHRIYQYTKRQNSSLQ